MGSKKVKRRRVIRQGSIMRAFDVYALAPTGDDSYVPLNDAIADPKLRAKALKALQKEQKELQGRLDIVVHTMNAVEGKCGKHIGDQR